MTSQIQGGTDIRLAINGDQVQGLMQASFTATNCFSADSFALTLAMKQSTMGGVPSWSSIASAYVEVSVIANGFLPSQNLITGMVDAVSIDPIRGVVAIEGRDLSSSLIDSYRQQDFVNQTASEVVSQIAQYHCLTAEVNPTSGNVGRYYGDGYTKLSLGQFSRLRSDWDLVVQLARENGFDAFVQGKTLFFSPAESAADTCVPLSVDDIQKIRVERRLTFTSDISARVQSWNSQNMMSYDSNGPNNTTPAPQVAPAATNQAFLFSSANSTSQQVTDSAGRYASELGRLATSLHIDMPWDFSIAPRTSILLSGTGSALDTTYRIDSIERHYDSRSGSVQSIRAVGF